MLFSIDIFLCTSNQVDVLTGMGPPHGFLEQCNNANFEGFFADLAGFKSLILQPY